MKPGFQLINVTKGHKSTKKKMCELQKKKQKKTTICTRALDDKAASDKVWLKSLEKCRSSIAHRRN